jgi:hypothetical protein
MKTYVRFYLYLLVSIWLIMFGLLFTWILFGWNLQTGEYPIHCPPTHVILLGLPVILYPVIQVYVATSRRTTEVAAETTGGSPHVGIGVIGTCVVGDSLVTVNNDCVVNCNDVVSCDVGDWLVIVNVIL